MILINSRLIRENSNTVLLLIGAALKYSKTCKTVILIVETKFHSPEKKYVINIILIHIFGTTLAKLASYVLTSLHLLRLATSKIIPTVGCKHFFAISKYCLTKA